MNVINKINAELEKAKQDDFRRFSESQGWGLTDLQVQQYSYSSGLDNVYATFEMLNLYIKNSSTGQFEQLKEYVTRDEMRIFLLVSLTESLNKLSNPSLKASRVATKEYFNTYILEQDKERIRNSFKIVRSDVSSQDVFEDWVDVLYGIRNAFAHEVQFICQVFSTSDREVYSYNNCRSIKDLKGKAWLTSFEAKNYLFQDFLLLISQSIRAWLIANS